ncbi:cytochrome P450 [Russula vinacea]|nr:cytochrome P450 [Russula vinacea]
MPTVLPVVLSLFALFLIQLLLGLRRVARNVGNLPGPFFLFSLDSVPGILIARIVRPIPYLNPGTTWMQSKKYDEFAATGKDAVSMVSSLRVYGRNAKLKAVDLQITAFPQPKCTLFVADAEANKVVTTSRVKFSKDLVHYAVLGIFGANIVVSEGEEWKKYRKIAAPAFSERNTKLVWDETTVSLWICSTTSGATGPKLSWTTFWISLFQYASHVSYLHFPLHHHQISLFAISAAGFGRRVTWTTDLVVPPGHQMTFKDALRTLSTNFPLIIILPGWAKNLTKHTRRVHLAFDELKQYMLEMVEARRNADKVEQHHDLFSGLLDAAQDEPDNGVALSEEELIGNMFIFLLAGHDSTAHALCFAFALLALHPDEQECLYQHIEGIMSSLNRKPAYEDMSRFTRSLAVLYETIRLFPPAPYVPKVAAEDATLTVSNADGGKTTFPVRAGTQIRLHIPGLHYNPRYWKDPHRFMPERFLGDWPKDAYIPFSQGARACLGRRFFETEGIAIVTMLVSRYKIEVKEEPEFAGETFEERYARITAFGQGLTTVPLRVPLVFKRR